MSINDIPQINFTNRVRLLQNVPLDNKKEHTRKFNNSTEQINYFTSKIVTTFDDVSPIVSIRSSIELECNPYDVWNCNYMMFQNETFNNKWFYCFITGIEYISPYCVKIDFELDLLQTYMFDYQIKECFVVREHSLIDTIGSNIIEEGLDVGEQVTISRLPSNILTDMSIVLAIAPTDGATDHFGSLYGGIYSGIDYLTFPPDEGGVGALNDIVQTIVASGKSSRIVSIFMCPTFLVTTPNSPVNAATITIGRPTVLGTYTPVNKKLFTYPYTYLQVSSPYSSNVFKFEYSNGSNVEFKLTGDYTISPTVYLIPKNYKGEELNIDSKLTLSNYPLCSWNNDAFSSWLANNRNSQLLQTAIGLGSIGVGLATGNVGGVIGGSTAIASQLASTVDRSNQNQTISGSTGGGGSALAVGIQDFYFSVKTCRIDYLQRLDKFFTTYGYKTNLVKVPNTTGRPYWNYVQTIDANINGNVPYNFISEIKNIYNNGVTFWHTDDVGNYALNNAI